MVELKPTEIVTPPVRIAFPSLWEPKPVSSSKGAKEKYQAVLLIPPSVDLKPFIACIKAAMEEKWGHVIKLKPRNTPITDCGEKEDIDGYEEGWHFINTNSKFQPGVLNQKKQEIIDEDQIFAGCWCRFHLNAWAYDNEFGKGVSFGLNSVQLVKEDDRLDGRRNAQEMYDEIEGDEEMFAGADDGVTSIDDLFS